MYIDGVEREGAALHMAIMLVCTVVMFFQGVFTRDS